MQLTKYTDYSLRVLLYLASTEGGATVRKVADSYGVSHNHLVKVVHNLGRLGLVRTTRGKSGGISLARPPEAINLGEVIRQVEPTLSLAECFSAKNNRCPITPVCALKDVLYEAKLAFFAVLDRYTIADVVRNREALRDILGDETVPAETVDAVPSQ